MDTTDTAMTPVGRQFRAGALGKLLALVTMTSLLIAACSSAVASPSPSPMPTPSSSSTPGLTAAPTKGPAAQTLGLVGPAGVTGALSNASIRCNSPSLTGTLISVLARPTDPNLSVFIFITAARVDVRFDSGSGATYVERDFYGTGVTNFNAATGATINTSLTETPNSDAHGTLGVLTSLAGSVDCGNQMPGSSSLTLSGLTAKGALSGGVDPVNVECISSVSNGNAVSVEGIVSVGGVPDLAVIYISPGTFSVAIGNATSSVGFFRNTKTGTATLTATGATLEGDLTEQNVAAGGTVHTIHMSGGVVCGTMVNG